MLYGFWISLDWPNASLYEAITLIEAYGGKIKHQYKVGRLLIVDTDLPKDCIKHIIKRSANIKEGFQIYCYLKNGSFEDTITEELLEDINSSKTTAVKVLKHNSVKYGRRDVAKLSRDLANEVLKGYKGKIDLINPHKKIVFISSKNVTASGIEIIGKHKKGFKTRIPSKRPVFSPFSLHPKLARLMINLSGALEGETILDPFCGVAGVAIEASLMKINSICVEIMYKWSLGCYKNIKWIEPNYIFCDVICGDSLQNIVNNVKYVVTDPPYGRITSIGSHTEANTLINDFLSYLSTINYLNRAVFMLPSDINVEFDKYGLREKYKITIPVHSALTRVLRVVEPVE